MSTIKIKITQDLEAIKNYELEPLVINILGGKLCFEPNESVLAAACKDIIWSLGHSTEKMFRYEKTEEGHFFYIDSSIFDDQRMKNIFTVMFFTRFEITNSEQLSS